MLILILSLLKNFIYCFQFNPDIMDCFSTLRLQISKVVDKTLQEWRTVHQKYKLSLLLKLQYLHDLHFLFLQYPYNMTVAENMFDGLKLRDLKHSESTV